MYSLKNDLNNKSHRFDMSIIFYHLDLGVALRSRQQKWDDLQRKYTQQTNILLPMVTNGGDGISLRLEYGLKRYEGLNNIRGLHACEPL